MGKPFALPLLSLLLEFLTGSYVFVPMCPCCWAWAAAAAAAAANLAAEFGPALNAAAAAAAADEAKAGGASGMGGMPPIMMAWAP